MIAIVDYGVGNLFSLVSSLKALGLAAEVTGDAGRLRAADRIILPGVGAFGDAMAALRSRGLEGPVKEYAASGRPFLGICLGLQLLFEESEEAPGVPGLGLFRGKIVRIPQKEGLKIPHIGWNSLALRQQGGLFQGLEEEPYVYFVHSYYLHASDPSIVSAQTEYGVVIDAAVCRGSLHAVQFHPEKSGKTGLAMLKNFAAML